MYIFAIGFENHRDDPTFRNEFFSAMKLMPLSFLSRRPGIQLRADSCLFVQQCIRIVRYSGIIIEVEFHTFIIRAKIRNRFLTKPRESETNHSLRIIIPCFLYKLSIARETLVT